MKQRILENIIGFYYTLIYWTVLYSPFIKLYQPVFRGRVQKQLTRACQDRWDSFEKYLPEHKGSVLDVGCNIGYFSFKCAEQGRFVCGVESHASNILICNAIQSKTQVDDCVFIKKFIDAEFISKAPDFDVVIHLSVFHHWVKQHGLEKAKMMMQQMTENTSCLVFETGQSTEVGSQWEKVLDFMGDKPEIWIESFLESLGFQSITNVGSFATGLTSTERFLFVARK